MFVAEVMVPFVIDQAYEVIPAGPLAVLPVVFWQTSGAAVMFAFVLLQSTSLKQIVASLSVGVTVLLVVARKAWYSR